MIDYDEEWIVRLIFRVKGSVALKALSFALPASFIAVAVQFLDDDIRSDHGLEELGASTIWAATTAALVFMIGFRTNRAISRFWEGTGLLHQMRGEWFDTVSNCVTFTIEARKEKPEAVKKFRHVLVRLMSLCHGNALEEISAKLFQAETIDVKGLDEETLMHLYRCNEDYRFNKVEVNLHLIQSLITTAFHEGILNVPAPILSRVFQTISRGFVNLLNTKKITDTKFPFPYAQLIAFLLIMNTLLTPLLVSSAVHNRILAAIFTFLPVFALSALNYISIELDNPFGTDDNDLPLADFQQEMNNCLMMLLHDNSEHIASASPSCIFDFADLMDNWRHNDEKDRASQITTTTTDESIATGSNRYDSGRFSDFLEPVASEAVPASASSASSSVGD